MSQPHATTKFLIGVGLCIAFDWGGNILLGAGLGQSAWGLQKICLGITFSCQLLGEAVSINFFLRKVISMTFFLLFSDFFAWGCESGV